MTPADVFLCVGLRHVSLAHHIGLCIADAVRRHACSARCHAAGALSRRTSSLPILQATVIRRGTEVGTEHTRNIFFTGRSKTIMKLHMACMSALFVAALARLSAAQTPTATPVDCEAVRCQVQSTLDQCAAAPAVPTQRPGNGQANSTGHGQGGSMHHGRYVRCVARTLHSLDVPQVCRGAVMQCAARSTVGRPGFETCTVPTFGSCDTSSGTCTEGTLAAGLTACTADTDCPSGTQCHVMRAFAPDVTPTPGADQCTLAGGTPGTGSCCPSCPSAPQ
jgi:hypothetical protein